MKRQIAAVLSILAVVGGVGWTLAGHRESSARLQEIRLDKRSEHSPPGATDLLAGIRIRISPSDFGYEVRATADKVPHISVATD
jgi:hypothetical protein